MGERQRQTDEKRQSVRGGRQEAGHQWIGTRRALLHPIHRLQQQVGNAHVQRMLADEREEEAPWARPEVGLAGGTISNQLASRIYGKLGHGVPLDSARKRELEAEFGVSLEDVQIHTDSEADFLSRQISARAFTLGRDIFFSNRASPEDEQVLRHEIAHVVQQQGMQPASDLTVGPAHDHLEEQARQVEKGSAELAATPSQPATLQRIDWEDVYNVFSNASGAAGAATGIITQAAEGAGQTGRLMSGVQGLNSALGPIGLLTGAIGFGQSVDQMLNAPNRADQAVGGFESIVNAAGAFSGGVGTASLLGLGTASLTPAAAVAGSFAGGYGAGRLLDEGVGWLGSRITGNENEDYTLSGMLAGGMLRADQAISSLWRDESKPAYTQTLGWKLGEWLGI